MVSWSNEYSSKIYLYFLQGKKGTLEITRKYANQDVGPILYTFKIEHFHIFLRFSISAKGFIAHPNMYQCFPCTRPWSLKIIKIVNTIPFQLRIEKPQTTQTIGFQSAISRPLVEHNTHSGLSFTSFKEIQSNFKHKT